MTKTEQQAKQIGENKRRKSPLVALKGFENHLKTLLDNGLINNEEYSSGKKIASSAKENFINNELGIVTGKHYY